MNKFYMVPVTEGLSSLTVDVRLSEVNAVYVTHREILHPVTETRNKSWIRRIFSEEKTEEVEIEEIREEFLLNVSGRVAGSGDRAKPLILAKSFNRDLIRKAKSDLMAALETL